MPTVTSVGFLQLGVGKTWRIRGKVDKGGKTNQFLYGYLT